MAYEDLKPSDILTREAFENAIVVNGAIGGSTNAPPHLQAIARHAGVPLDVKDWETVGFDVPLLLNMQPAGEYLGESFFRAGGVPAVVGGGLAYLQTGDMVRLDLNASRMDALVPEDEWQARKDAWQPPEIVNQTPWQEIYRTHVGQLSDDGYLELATAYQKVAKSMPRDIH